MMSISISGKCDLVASEIISRFQSTGHLIRKTDNDKFRDYSFSSDLYRRAHISIVDAREEHKVWLLHVTVFPHLTTTDPIYGFDIIAGPNKVSGAFHDFSPIKKTNKLCKWFHKKTADLAWNKRRELPDWAKPIFSNDIVAIGAVGLDELTQFCELGLETLDHYLDMLNLDSTEKDHTEEHNFYCLQQRLNLRTGAVLKTLGFTEDEARAFIENNLFPLV